MTLRKVLVVDMADPPPAAFHCHCKEDQQPSNRQHGTLMATQKQIEANAFKTGIDAQSLIIRAEDPVALELLTRQYYERFQPQGPAECNLIDTAIADSWLLRRLRKQALATQPSPRKPSHPNQSRIYQPIRKRTQFLPRTRPLSP